MVFKNLCIFVHWGKGASALKGLIASFKNVVGMCVVLSYIYIGGLYAISVVCVIILSPNNLLTKALGKRLNIGGKSPVIQYKHFIYFLISKHLFIGPNR